MVAANIAKTGTFGATVDRTEWVPDFEDAGEYGVKHALSMLEKVKNSYRRKKKK